MATILDYRPEVATAISEGKLEVSLSEDARATLGRINDRIVALVTPLTCVVSLSDAQMLVATKIDEYLRLAKQWTDILLDAGVSVAEFEEGNVGHFAHLPNDDDNERWQGALQSAAAYLDWAHRVNKRLDSGEEIVEEELRKVDWVMTEVYSPLARFEMAKHAIKRVLAKSSGSSSSALSALAQLADNCMTEVEDVFLAQADYGEDDGQRVSFEEFRANLAL